MNCELIKVCGMREAENIREVEQLFTLHSSLFTSWMGFIFWPKSKRYVSERPDYLPLNCKRVGVFVDADIEDIRLHIEDFGLDMIQLHGQESPDFIRRLCSVCGDGIATIKAINIATAEDMEQTKPYEGLVDYFLFDTKATLPGGSGQQFDWNVLEAYDGNTPFLLSGGIGPDDAERVKQFFTLHSSLFTSKCLGIDLNSRFEIVPGLKDVNKLKDFLEKIQE